MRVVVTGATGKIGRPQAGDHGPVTGRLVGPGIVGQRQLRPAASHGPVSRRRRS